MPCDANKLFGFCPTTWMKSVGDSTWNPSSLFGSVARDQAGPVSDLDILVAYTRTPGLFGFLDLKEYLEGLLGCPVDLVTRNALKRQLRNKILQESVRVH